MNFEKGALNYFSVPLNSNQENKISLTQKSETKTPNKKKKKERNPNTNATFAT